MGVGLPYSKISKGTIGDALNFGYYIVCVSFEGFLFVSMKARSVERQDQCLLYVI
jgi:hypothetical protein